MKTLPEIIQEITLEEARIAMAGKGSEQLAAIRKRLQEDSALRNLILTTYLAGKLSNMFDDEAMATFALARIVIVWEKANEIFNAQLQEKPKELT